MSTSLPTFVVGSDVVFEERWRGRLWTAVPHRVIASDSTRLVGWVPLGTRSVYATNRGLPEAAGLSRDERKLLALKTGRAVAVEFAEEPAKLCIYRRARWSRVILGWGVGGEFLGWYVDFELPVQATTTGLASKDLVLDLWVDPDGAWHWKDRDDLERATAHGLLPAEARAALHTEADQILSELEGRRGPFGDEYRSFVPAADWDVPVLPPSHQWGGSDWTLPPGPRE